jgi:hypothetical protein
MPHCPCQPQTLLKSTFQTATPPGSQSEPTHASNVAITQSSLILPPTYPPPCIIIDKTATPPPMRTLRMQLCPRSTSSNLSTLSTDSLILHNTLTIVPPPEKPPPPPDPAPTQDNCSALAQHLFSHAKDHSFLSKAEVAAWCHSTIKVEIFWHLNTIGLMSMARTSFCRLCAVECMLIGQNFNSTRSKRLFNLKSELHGICSCKTRFLWFSRSG